MQVEANEKENETSQTMRITQISTVVESQSKALEFYTQKVGFEKKIDFPTPAGYRWIVVWPKGQDLGIALVEAGWRDDSGIRGDWRVGGAPPVVIQVENCRKKYEELKSRGVEFKQPYGEDVKTVPYGTVAFFADPDGNLFEVLEPSKALQVSLNAAKKE